MVTLLPLGNVYGFISKVRVANFVTNRYGNERKGRRVSVMPLRNADKSFYMANFTRNVPIGNYFLYYLTSEAMVFR